MTKPFSLKTSEYFWEPWEYFVLNYVGWLFGIYGISNIAGH